MSATIKQGALPHLYTIRADQRNAPSSPPTSSLGMSLDLASMATASLSASKPVRREPSLGSTASPRATSPSKASKTLAALNPAVDPTKIILTFRGFFNESVPESPIENYRVRRLVLRFFIDDGTTDIFDPDIRNDGIIHGPFLKRTTMPSLSRDNFLEKLRVGGTVDCFGRAIRLYACDEWTKKFFADLGYPQEGDFEPPLDKYSREHPEIFEDPTSKYYAKGSSSITRFIEAASGNNRSKKDTLARSLRYQAAEFKFKLFWVDAWDGQEFRHHYQLTYYPVDEETEIIEQKVKGTARPPIFLKKRRLPRFVLPHDNRMRSCDDETGDEDYYNEDDFIVGSHIEVFGRNMVIYDCDDATQAWYLKEKGIDQRSNRVDVSDPPTPAIVHPTPPPPVFGGEEDTLNSLKYLIPKQLKREMREPAMGFLRYIARLKTADPVDGGRVFLVTYYRDTKEVGVYEPPLRNSGVLGGNFLRRCKAKNPVTEKLFEESEFYPGAELVINRFTFTFLREDDVGKKGIMDGTIGKVLNGSGSA